MSLLNTGLNAIGTVAALKSLFGKSPSSNSKEKLNQFYSEIRANSVARTTLFDVQIAAPKMLQGSAAKIAPKISLFAEGAALPGLFIQTGETKRFGVGPNEKYPYSLQTNTIALNFIADGKGELYKFFYNWMQNIVRADFFVPSNEVTNNGLAPYEVEFKDQYSTTINLFVYSEQGDVILQYELQNAFPTRIPDINLSWTNENSMMQFGVDFEFLQSKLINAEEAFKVGKNGIKQPSLLQKAIKIATAVQTIASLRRPRSIQDALSSVSTVKNISI